MRIDNNMAGFRPQAHQAKTKVKFLSGRLPSVLKSTAESRALNDKSDDFNSSEKHDDRMIKQKVHKRQKLVQAASILANRGGL
jgi:hypothetical protein